MTLANSFFRSATSIRLASRTAVNIDELASFCVADEVVQKVRDHISGRLGETNVPAVQRRHLNDVQQSMDAALLPAVRKMADLLQKRAIGFCSPRSTP